MTTQTRGGTATNALVQVLVDNTATDFSLSFGSSATVGDLLDEFRSRFESKWGPDLYVNGVRFETERILADLPIGDGVTFAPLPPVQRRPSIGRLVAVAGRDAGRAIYLSEGHYPAGSALTVPITARNRMLAVGDQVGKAYGSSFNDDQTAWRWEATEPHRQPSSGLFNRPPRQLPAPIPAPPPLPLRDVSTSTGSALRWTMIVGPLIMGAVMIIIFRRPSFAIFMALGPLMAIMNWWDAKRRGRKTDRVADIVFRAAIASTVKKLRSWVTTAQSSGLYNHPDLPTILRWPHQRHQRLWERRPHHEDFGRIALGYTAVRDHLMHGSDVDPLVAQALATKVPAGTLPILCDVASGQVIGVIGRPNQTAALTRNLLIQLAIHHGPADLALRICAAPSSAGSWNWTHWLPHTRDHLGESRVDVTPQDLEARLADPTNAILVIDHLYEPNLSNAVRSYADSGGTVVVISNAEEDLPGSATQIVSVKAPQVSLKTTGSGSTILGTGLFVATDVCSDAARDLSGVGDPETTSSQGRIPSRVDLLDLLDLGDLDPSRILQRWRDDPDRIRAPVGVSESGVMNLDIVHDGPPWPARRDYRGWQERTVAHACGLPGGHSRSRPPQFRAHRLQGRERVRRLCRPTPRRWRSYRSGRPPGEASHDLPRSRAGIPRARLATGRCKRPSRLPSIAQCRGPSRLYLVVDEFAAMAKDLPEFMDALVDIAARGRSLGVHMMLATQRPAGVVKDTIRANTNLRIGLRVQTIADSRDVLDDPVAATLPRTLPGRGFVRFGPSELTGFQTALVTGSSTDVAGDRVALFPLGAVTPGASTTPPRPSGPTDLERLVRAICEAAATAGTQPARTPWPPALPEELPLTSIGERDGDAFGMVDEPQKQRQSPYRWDRRTGHLALYGMPGTGPERAAESAVAAICEKSPEVAVYVLAYGTHHYDSLIDIPQVAPVIAADDLERQSRLIRQLGTELQERRGRSVGSRPDIIVVIDDLGACLKSLEPFHLVALMDTLAEVLSKGHTLGIHVVGTAFSSTALRTKLATGFSQRLAFSFADPTHYSGLGIRASDVPTLGYGQAVDATTSLLVQVATDHAGTTFGPSPKRPAVPIMPREVERLSTEPHLTSYPWQVPLGIGETNLSELSINLDQGDHLLIAGPIRSGKTSTLAMIASQLAGSGVQLVGVTPRRSVLSDAAPFKYLVDDPAAVADLGQALISAEEGVMVLVDDAELVEGLEDLLKARNPYVTIIAAIRSTEASRMYTHWTRRLKDSGSVLLLQPVNGDIAGVKLPKSIAPQPIGRGFLCTHGTVEAIQVAKYKSGAPS